MENVCLIVRSNFRDWYDFLRLICDISPLRRDSREYATVVALHALHPQLRHIDAADNVRRVATGNYKSILISASSAPSSGYKLL
ncbi:UNVERIFIED_CONTAM: hypothetical protein Sradi_5714800 [Sesamum radiatum]|uniref:Uncharacterized protein n=1 Tax=Sesamum radiatum TaxID=300843 RepID=A0AAW2L1L9_SESRA